MDKRKEFNSKRNVFFNQFKVKACGNCGIEDDLSIHHVVPLASGGNNVITNMVLLCNDCHGKIHGKDFAKMRKLQRKGIEKAREQGKYTSRPKKITEESLELHHAVKLYQQKETVKNICKITGIGRTTLYDHIKRNNITRESQA